MSTRTVVNILVIDDSMHTLRLLQLLLDDMCFSRYEVKIITASDLVEARMALRNNTFDAVITDLMLADSHGIDTFRVVKAIFGNVPILVMSGVDDLDLAFQMMDEGLEDFFQKSSMSSNGLVERILFAITRHRRRKRI